MISVHSWLAVNTTPGATLLCCALCSSMSGEGRPPPTSFDSISEATDRSPAWRAVVPSFAGFSLAAFHVSPACDILSSLYPDVRPLVFVTSTSGHPISMPATTRILALMALVAWKGDQSLRACYCLADVNAFRSVVGLSISGRASISAFSNLSEISFSGALFSSAFPSLISAVLFVASFCAAILRHPRLGGSPYCNTKGGQSPPTRLDSILEADGSLPWRAVLLALSLHILCTFPCETSC